MKECEIRRPFAESCVNRCHLTRCSLGRLRGYVSRHRKLTEANERLPERTELGLEVKRSGARVLTGGYGPTSDSLLLVAGPPAGAPKFWRPVDGTFIERRAGPGQID